MLFSSQSSIIAASLLLLQSINSVQGLAFPYGSTKMRGVSLGGWLLLEPFITPSIFEATNDPAVVDEFTYGRKYGSVAAGARLKNHWDTFITENDIATIKSYGLNHVRIPVGYWSILPLNATETYPVGAYPYVRRAVQWCQKYGLKVVLDLHGAPGSQNGFDNSGRRGPIAWHTSPVNIQRTRAALKVLIDDFVVPTTFRDTVTSVQALNEPAGFAGGNVLDVIKQFYYDSYGALRWPFGTATQADTLLSLHDAFQNPASYWQGFMPYPSWTNVALDTHYYSIFDATQLRWSNQQRIDAICSFGNSITGASLWTYAGEWTPADTDCAGSTTVTNAVTGSMYDGTLWGSTRVGSCVGKTGSGATFSEAQKTFMRQYWETQANVYERGIGWIQWTWKTEAADEWSYSKGVQYGWIPRNPAERKYSDLCKTRLPPPPVVTTTSTSTTSTSSKPSSTTTKISTSVKTTTKPTTSTVKTTSKPITTSKPVTTSRPATTTPKTTSTTPPKTTSTSALTGKIARMKATSLTAGARSTSA